MYAYVDNSNMARYEKLYKEKPKTCNKLRHLEMQKNKMKYEILNFQNTYIF